MDNKQKKNSDAKIRANNKYKKANYKSLSVCLKPEQVDDIKSTANAEGISIAQYIYKCHIEHKEL